MQQQSLDQNLRVYIDNFIFWKLLVGVWNKHFPREAMFTLFEACHDWARLEAPDYTFLIILGFFHGPENTSKPLAQNS